MAILNHSVSLVVYDDASASNNPTQRFADWKRNLLVTIANPQNQRFVIPPNSTQTVFSGVRTALIDNTTAFSLTLNSYNSSIYRITNTGGTAPGFRTDRGLTLSGSTVTVAINNNSTATFTTTGSYGTTVPGDTVFVPTVLTGDPASPFSATNGGYWVVLNKTATVLTLARPSGVSFSAAAEVVTLTTNAQLQAFSSAGVQVDDTLEISSGFSAITQKTFTITSVNPFWVEFISTDPLPLETGIIPTTTGLVFHTDAKRFLRIEADQEAAVRLNGDSGNSVRISPRAAGNISSGFGYMEKWGTSWSLDVVNRSRTDSMTLIVFSAE